MADLSLLRARVNYGLGIAANTVGRPVTQYRPYNILSPLDNSAVISVFMAAFDAVPNLQLTRPIEIGKSAFYLLANATNLQVGDYLVGTSGTYFIASMEDLRPPLMIRANASVSLVRPTTGVSAGLNPPGGDSLLTETTIFANWPASVLIGGRSEPGEVALAGDLRMGGWQVLLPRISDIEVRGSDILVDQQSLRRIVVSAELSPMGWRIDTEQEAS